MKFTISRSLEIGQAVKEFLENKMTQNAGLLEYLSQFVEQAIRGLKNGLTFQDNFDCMVTSYKVSTGVAQIVNAGTRKPIGMLPLRVVSQVYGLDSFLWYTNNKGEIEIKATFTGSPTSEVELVVVILY